MNSTLDSINLLLKILWNITTKQKKIESFFIIVFSIISSLLQYFNIVLTAFSFSFITSLAYSGNQTKELDFIFWNKIELQSDSLANIIIIWIISSIVTYLSVIFSSYSLYKLAYSFGKILTEKLLKVALVSNSIFYENISEKTLFNLLTAESTMLIKGAIFSLITLPLQISTIIALITIIINYSFSLFIVLPIISIFYFFTSNLIFKSVSNLGTKIFNLRSFQTDLLSRVIDNYLDVKFPPSDKAYKKLFNDTTKKLRDIESFIATIPKLLKAFLELILILMIGIYLFYSINIINLPIEVFISSSAAVILSLLKLTPILSGISSNFLSFNSQYESIKNYNHLLFNTKKYSLFSNYFNYSKVIMSTNYELIIENLGNERISKYCKKKLLSLKMNEEKLLWITGKSGCGKSTFISLVAGIRPISKGQINLFIDKNETPIKDQMISNYMHEKIAYMPQNPIFHSTTVLDYIVDGHSKLNTSKIKRIIRKLKICNSFGFSIEKLLRLVIGPRGYTPSGGQAKLLSFARTLYKDKVYLYLLDEPTSELNEELKDIVLKVIYELSKEKFVMSITHDLNNIRTNDRQLIL